MSISAATASPVRSSALRQLQERRTQDKAISASQRQAEVSPAVQRMDASPDAVAGSRARASAFDQAAQFRIMNGVYRPDGMGSLEGLQMVHHRPGHNPSIAAPPSFPGNNGNNGNNGAQPQLPRPPSRPQQPTLPHHPNQPRRGIPGFSA